MWFLSYEFYMLINLLGHTCKEEKQGAGSISNLQKCIN